MYVFAFFQQGELKMIGSLVAMSIVQGGPGFPLFLPQVVTYISTGHYDVEPLTDTDVPDWQVQYLLTEVC